MTTTKKKRRKKSVKKLKYSNKKLNFVDVYKRQAEAGGLGLAIVQPRSYGVEIRVIKTVPQAGVLLSLIHISRARAWERHIWPTLGACWQK